MNSDTLLESPEEEQMVTLTGDTYAVRGQLYAIGARFDTESRAWKIRASRAPKAQALIPKSRPGTERLTCILCGTEFMWLECVTIGWPHTGASRGDWNKSWCGCAKHTKKGHD